MKLPNQYQRHDIRIRYHEGMSKNFTEDIDAILPEHRMKTLEIIKEYQNKRLDWYRGNLKPIDRNPSLKKLLAKDIAMFAARGITTAEEYVEAAFHAIESSSEETVMGNTWQHIITEISNNTVESGDFTTERDGIIWVCELKSQTNTTNSSSFPQELRTLKARVEESSRRRRASRKQVKAAICISRDNNPKDEIKTYTPSDFQYENRDLAGFEYRYISGEKFWKWLTGYSSAIGLLMPLSHNITGGNEVAEARTQCIQSLKCELRELLAKHELSNSIDDLVKLRARI